MTNRTRRRPLHAMGAALLATLATFTLSACSGTGQQEPANRYLASSFGELIDRELTRDDEQPDWLSDFEREVFTRAKTTGRIAQADYDDAYSRYSQCMADLKDPITLKKLKNGIYRVDHAPLTPGDSIEASIERERSCTEGVTSRVPDLFGIQQGNPTLLSDPDEAAYNCLRDNALISPEDYTLDDFKQHFQPHGPGEQGFPFDHTSDDAQACLEGANISIG